MTIKISIISFAKDNIKLLTKFTINPYKFVKFIFAIKFFLVRVYIVKQFVGIRVRQLFLNLIIFPQSDL